MTSIERDGDLSNNITPILNEITNNTYTIDIFTLFIL